MSLSGFPNGFGVSGFGSHQKNRALLAALCHMSSLGKGVMGVTFFFFFRNWFCNLVLLKRTPGVFTLGVFNGLKSPV